MKDGSTITDNTIAGKYASDNYLQYSADLWIGANATGAIAAINGGTVGSIFVNTNEYSSNNPGSFALNGGTIENIYVEYYKGFGGAFTYTSATINNLYLSTLAEGISVQATLAEKNTYHGGVVAKMGDTYY